ncbi:hypothetical protein LO80_04435 [Candidatus Francisella endociliophora]|uniref:Lipoprotein n=1 Tax=Candidatus Francisella endociliophora TaxID=653937 RepID=A0A097ENZ6_9GAMM|nr:hypothetical protein [Francisella sp. FSC1006]AIT09287.1 hypothetical protein LO80_04435 [Francisella sp. FSC1006]
MRKYKLLTVALAGLVLASCINEQDKGVIKSSTAGATIDGTDLRTISGWTGGTTGNAANIGGFNVLISNNGTIVKSTCPAGMVSFIGEKTCNNAADGCEYRYLQVVYGSGGSGYPLGWSSNTIPVGNGESRGFVFSNAPIGGGDYVTNMRCVPISQVGYWS